MNRRAKAASAKAEKKQQTLESGAISALYPKVAKITISMTYAQTGVLEPLARVVNFLPDGAAFFKISCLCADCPESRFDFTKIIQSMIKAQKTSAKGTVSCENCTSPEHEDVAYVVTIKYRQASAKK